MKNLLLAAIAVMILSACAGSVAESPISAEESARAFLAHGLEVDHFQGDFSFVRLLPDGRREVPYGQFRLGADWWVTRLDINGQLVIGPDDEPMSGLPINTEGSVTEFHLWLHALNGNGMVMKFGSFSAELLLPGQGIEVEFEPASSRHFIPFNSSTVDGQDLGLRFAGQDHWWGYSPHQQGFEIWLAVITDPRYEIFDVRTGRVLSRGTLGQDQDKSSTISARHLGGVRPILVGGRENEFLARQKFDSVVYRDSGWWSAAVYMADLEGRPTQLNVWGGLTTTGRIEVRQWTAVGQMPLIIEATNNRFVDWAGRVILDEFYVQIPAGYDRVVITVIGETDDEGFYFATYRSGKG
ncbi:MAG: hypothetical protein WDZ85_01520 [Candidatus Paceibacterota bacterium]